MHNPRETLDQAFLKRPDNLHPEDQFASRKQDEWAPVEKAPVVKRQDSYGSHARKYEGELDERWAPGEHANQEVEDGVEIADNEDAFLDNIYGLQCLGRSQDTTNELTVKLQISEKNCEEFAIKLAEMTKLYEDAKVLAQDNVKLRYEFDCIKMENESSKEDKSKIEIDLLSVKADNDTLNKRLHEVENELKSVKMDNEILKQDKSKLEDNLRSFKDNNDALRKVQMESTAKIKWYGTELECVKRENEGLEREMTKLKDKLKIFEANNEILKQDKSKLEDDLRYFKDEYDASKKVQMESTAKINRYGTELDCVKKENEGLKREMTKLKDELKILEADYGDLKKRLCRAMICLERQLSDRLAELPLSLNQMKRKSLLTLNDETRVNNESIDMYSNLVNQRSSKNRHLPKVYSVNALLYRRFSDLGYERAKRFIPSKINIFTYDLVFIPIHTGEGNGSHWTLVVIDFEKKGIFYYDSLGGDGTDIMLKIINFLEHEHLAKKKKNCEVRDVQDFKLKNMTDIPKQSPNSVDCGIFVMKYVDFLSCGEPLTFTQERMPYYRKHMKVELFYEQFM